MESIAARRIPYSQIRVMFDKAKRLEREGRDIIHLEIGRPDFNTPDHIVEAAVQALRRGEHHYSQNAGIFELRRAIAEKYASEYSLEYDSETEIVVTNGVAEGVYVAIHALLDPGDQVLVPDPRWVNYDIDAYTNFVDPIPYMLHEDKGFQPEPEEIRELLTPRTKAILLASPSNPTGGVNSRQVLEDIARISIEKDLLVISDEIYEKIVYAPAGHVSIGTLPGMRQRTLVLNGFSKSYSMTGWRLGYVCGPAVLVNPILRYHQYMITSTNTFAQWGAVTALKGGQTPLAEMVREFERRRDFLVEAVNRIPGFRCTKPDGAFYLFPSIRETGLSGFEMADLLLEKAGVAAVAGECFGRRGAGHIRFSYASSMDNLKSAAERIGEAVRNI